MAELQAWINDLASSAPAPGGGGASALVGAVAASLGRMVGCLTDGKKKYAAYQADIERIMADTDDLKNRLYALIQADADAFVPLSAAYGIPKDDPTRTEKLESALRVAAEPPMAMLETLAELPPILEELCEKGSRLAISDVGCAATFASAAASGALLNLFVNTRLMQDKVYAAEQNTQGNIEN
jgi:formiminotetrahydrofolate cyclodeaminase